MPPPSPVLRRSEERIPLGRNADLGDENLGELLVRRRTNRAFKRAPVDRDRFSRLLELTWGATAIVDDPWVGQHTLRTSPSGGARHPVEVYPIVLSVEGVAAGIYHYAVVDHAHELITPGAFEREAVAMCAGQAWVQDAAAVFLMTAVLPRSMSKYPQDHAYRVVHLDNTILGMRVYDTTGMGFLENYIGEAHSKVLGSLKNRQAVFFGRASNLRGPDRPAAE